MGLTINLWYVGHLYRTKKERLSVLYATPLSIQSLTTLDVSTRFHFKNMYKMEYVMTAFCKK